MGEAKRRKILHPNNYGLSKLLSLDGIHEIGVPTKDFLQACKFIEQQERQRYKRGECDKVMFICLTNDESGFTQKEIEMLSYWCKQRTWQANCSVGAFLKECPTLEKAVIVFSNLEEKSKRSASSYFY